jgi:cytochrome c5
MTRTHLTIALAAAAALAGCDQSDRTNSTAESDQQANQPSAAPVEMPPAIVASKIYRCKDNSVVYIDWLADNQTANFRAQRGGTPTILKTATAGGALTAEGYSLIGLPTANTVTLTRPGAGEQACKA